MIMVRDNDFSFRETDHVTVAAMSVIGDRKEQEDCFGFVTDNGGVLLSVCDGMGGYSGGGLASRTAVETVLREADLADIGEDPPPRLRELSAKANTGVLKLHAADEKNLKAGSTIVLIYTDKNALYWNSVGDSRLYIRRNNEFLQITKDQNYRTVLEEKRSFGEISEEEYLRGQARADALVSYLGINELSLIDYNTEPLTLLSGDILLVCTDGLYRVLTDEEITAVLAVPDDLKTKLQMIEHAVRKKAKDENINRDNMTVALIKVK